MLGLDGLLVRRLARLLALLLLLLLQPHLFALLHIQLCSRRETGAVGNAFRLLGLLGLFIHFVVVAGCGGFGGLLRICGGASAEHDLARRSLALVADHEEVVAGAFQQLGQHVARGTGPERAENALVVVQAFNLCAGFGGNIGKDLLQAGVCGVDF